MASLLDIVPITSEVTIQGHKIPIFPIGGEGVGMLIFQYKSVRQMFASTSISTVADDLVLQAPDAVLGIIALATTNREDFPSKVEWIEQLRKVEKAAAKISVADQIKILTETIKITFAEGTGPFADLVREFTAALAPANQDRPEEASGTTSDGRSSAAFQTGIRPEKHGTTHPDNSTGGLNS